MSHPRQLRPGLVFLVLLGFAAVAASLPFTWFTLRPEFWPAGVEAHLAGTHFEDHAQALLACAAFGALTAVLGRNAVTLLVPPAAAAVAVAVVLHASRYPTVAASMNRAQAEDGFYIGLAGAVVALAASAPLFLETLHREREELRRLGGSRRGRERSGQEEPKEG